MKIKSSSPTKINDNKHIAENESKLPPLPFVGDGVFVKFAKDIV